MLGLVLAQTVYIVRGGVNKVLDVDIPEYGERKMQAGDLSAVGVVSNIGTQVQ